jgi:hypothetical protein
MREAPTALIVGAGVGGLAAAIALRRGLERSRYERVSALRLLSERLVSWSATSLQRDPHRALRAGAAVLG